MDSGVGGALVPEPRDIMSVGARAEIMRESLSRSVYLT